MVVGNHHLSCHHYHHHENIQLRSHSNVIGTVVGIHHFEGTLHGRSKYIGGSIVLVNKHSTFTSVYVNEFTKNVYVFFTFSDVEEDFC